MNHPTREDLVAYLYSELAEPDHHQLESHLHTCPDCMEQLAAWKQAQSSLDAWEIPALKQRYQPVQPIWKWAVAAMLVLGIGFGLGYAASLKARADSVRAELEASLKSSLAQDLRQVIRKELQSEFEASLAAASRQTLEASLERAERLLAAYDAKRQEAERTQLASLRNYFDARLNRQASDLETVALLTEATFRNAQRQISQLAGYTPVSLKDQQ